jgi:hypothetical protein
LGIIDQIVGVENFQPLQFEKTPFTSEGEGLGMGALALLLCEPCAKQERFKTLRWFKSLRV